MKRFIAILVIVCFVLAPITAFAGRSWSTGSDNSADGHASDHIKFKGNHTFGSDYEKPVIMRGGGDRYPGKPTDDKRGKGKGKSKG